MKILDASIEDPRAVGRYGPSVLYVYTDEIVQEQGDPIKVKGLPGYRVIPCGPFFATEHWTSESGWIDVADDPTADIGRINTSGLLKDQLFPVVVNSHGDLFDVAMIVPRARRLMRKYQGNKENPYELIVDESAALQGLLKWRLELSTPVCYGGATPGAAQCYRHPKATIVFKETHLPLCAHHQLEHQNRLAAERVTSKKSHPANN